MVAGHFLGDGRARTDQAHVALEHVPELRQLVEGELAQQAANGRDPRIGLGLEDRAGHLVEVGDVAAALVRVLDHRPELVEHEGSAVQPDALLLEEHGAG